MQGEVEEAGADYWVWGRQAGSPRILHAMIRVMDLDASIRFYTDAVGMRLLDRHDFPDYRFSIAFLSFEGYGEGPALELTYNWDQAEGYTHGSGFGHVALGVPDIEAACARLEAHGAELVSGPRAMMAGAPRLAFVKDPDGYSLELIETAQRASSQ